MDLIDLSKIDFYKLTGPELVSAMEEAPSVPAVPLDKLCELLSKGAYPCTILSESLCPFEKCIDTGRYSNDVSKECWKAVLTKWMEEQDAKEET